MNIDKKEKIYVAGCGLIGSAIVRKLNKEGYKNVVCPSHADLDLTDQSMVRKFFDREKPAYVFLTAAKVGGVFANNTYRAEFIYENLMIQNNVIHQVFLSGVKKMVFLACADVYPKNCQQPMKEEFLLTTGAFESTCEPFAVAKLAGIKMCESYNRQYGTDFTVVIPPNVYGSHQLYDVMNSQVLPALIKKFHEAKVSGEEKVVIWGSGHPERDFLFVGDVADACFYLMKEENSADVFNIGTGKGCSISELAFTINKVIGFRGKMIFDHSKPDGAAKKLLDTTKINKLGWHYKTNLMQGIQKAYQSFQNELVRKEIRTSRVCYVSQHKKDIDALKKITAKPNNFLKSPQPDSYRNRIVIKPWGHEFLIFENDFVAVWLLYIKKKHSTSMHCHSRKKTSLDILSGEAMNNTFKDRRYLRGGDALILDKGVFHSTKALSDDGVFLLEIETPPEKTDLIRLEDLYGRQKRGYEGITEMETNNLKDYGYFYFENDKSKCEEQTYKNDIYMIKHKIFSSKRNFKENFKINSDNLYILCGGKICDAKNKAVLEIGDVQSGEMLGNLSGLSSEGKVVLLETTGKLR